MVVNKTEAIVLGSANLVGADKIVTVYSPEYGQIRGVAHGVKRIKNPFGSALEPLTHISLIFKLRPNRELQLIQQADIINNFAQIRKDIIFLTAGLYSAELVQKLTPLEGCGQPQIFRLLIKALDLLSSRVDLFSIIHIFEVRLLGLLGYKPNLDKCLFCSATGYSQGWGFSPNMGGILCNLCKSKANDLLFISPGGLMFLRKALQLDLETIGRLKIMPWSKKETEKLLQATLSQYLSSPIKSYPVLLNLLKHKNS